MTIDTKMFRKAGIDNTNDAKAQAAVKAFRALQPTLSSYARVLTKRKDVRVEMATSGAKSAGETDGKRIFFVPPIALGENVPHERRLCDKRDSDRQLMCRACKIREGVLVTIYHEISHILNNTMDNPSDTDRAELISRAVRAAGGKWADEIAAKIKSAPRYATDSYLGMASLVDEFLPWIVNGLEDARINAEMFKARKGTKVMFESDTWRIFTEGVEQKDKSVKKWIDYPKNMQVIVGVFCKASGYDYKDWFIEPVLEALGDKKLTELCLKLRTVRSVGGVYNLAFPVLERLQELGFCLKEEPKKEEPEGEPCDEGEPDESGGESGGDESSETEKTSEKSEDSEPSEAESEESPDGGDDQSDKDDGDDDSEDTGTDRGSSEDAGDSEPEEDSESDGTSGGSSDQPVNDDSDDDSDESSDSESSDEGEDGPDKESDINETEDSETDSSDAGVLDGDAGSSTDGSHSSDSSSESGTDFGLSDSTDGSGESEDKGPEEAGHSNEEESGTSDESLNPDSDEPADDEPVESGADDGTGGIEIHEKEEYDHIPYGTPDDVKKGIKVWTHHEGDDLPSSVDEEDSQNAVDRAIIQGIYFETPSRHIWGVREHHYGEPVYAGRSNQYNVSTGWNHALLYGSGISKRLLGVDGNFETPQKILGDALLRMRVTFADNARGHTQRNLKSGKVNTRVLGKRAWQDDERVFKRRSLPGKKDYFVLLGMDISGSTVGTNIVLEKKCVMAQATLLHKMGIRFAIYAHTGNYHTPEEGRAEGMDLDIYLIKEPDEMWDSKAKERLMQIGPDSANLDGHSIEYYRKVLDRINATDKILLYYSDGKMPAENYDEELEILQREIKVCKRKRYTLMCIGIRTDSPIRHGLDTVQVDREEDIPKVVIQLESRLLRA